jgi:hypothetical protein
LPETLLGDFFVLGYDRDRMTYILVADDADDSSYNLGRDIPTIMEQFKRWGWADIGNRAIDAAREFRLVQVIPQEDRVIRLHNPDLSGAAHIAKRLQEQEQEQGHVRHLR